MKKDYEQFSTTISSKFVKQLRLHAFKSEIALNSMLELYQNSFNRLFDQEKKDKIKVVCQNCKKKDYPSYFWLISEDKYCCSDCKDKEKC